jgi:hypothetical protein
VAGPVSENISANFTFRADLTTTGYFYIDGGQPDCNFNLRFENDAVFTYGECASSDDCCEDDDADDWSSPVSEDVINCSACNCQKG